MIPPGQCLYDEVREDASVVWVYVGSIGVEDAYDAHIGANLVLKAKRQSLGAMLRSFAGCTERRSTVAMVVCDEPENESVKQ